ncbi:NADH dehydrogenase 1 alpha subcomplex subunit 2 [Trichonephila clavipes]|nr:NADH dehydrogenase 1 alpha subcomplex subunit 2 [Trichonephila clavipes]
MHLYNKFFLFLGIYSETLCSYQKQNPAFPILIRECEGIEPRIYARYDFGKETSVSLSNNKSDEVLEIVRKLTNTSSK